MYEAVGSVIVAIAPSFAAFPPLTLGESADTLHLDSGNRAIIDDADSFGQRDERLSG